MTGLELAAVKGLSRHDFCAKLALRWRSNEAVPDCDAWFSEQDSIDAEASVGGVASCQLIELEAANSRVLEVELRHAAAETVSNIMYFREITREIEIDRMKSEFLATAAHELRTPMASILGFAEVLLNTEVGEVETKEYLGIIYNQSKVIATIINDLLDLARIEAHGKADFKFESLHLAEVLKEVVDTLHVPKNRQLPLVQQLADDDLVWADRFKLIQALNNVINNAYKYSPAGGDVVIELLPPEKMNILWEYALPIPGWECLNRSRPAFMSDFTVRMLLAKFLEPVWE